MNHLLYFPMIAELFSFSFFGSQAQRLPLPWGVMSCSYHHAVPSVQQSAVPQWKAKQHPLPQCGVATLSVSLWTGRKQGHRQSTSTRTPRRYTTKLSELVQIEPAGSWSSRRTIQHFSQWEMNEKHIFHPVKWNLLKVPLIQSRVKSGRSLWRR